MCDIVHSPDFQRGFFFNIFQFPFIYDLHCLTKYCLKFFKGREHNSNPGIKPASLVSPALADRFFTTEPLGKP